MLAWLLRRLLPAALLDFAAQRAAVRACIEEERLALPPSKARS